MWDIVVWIIVGIIAGWLAGVITRTDRGIWGDMLLGLVGALIAGFVFDGIGDYNFFLKVIVATLGAIVVVVVKNLIMSRT